jgi:hypothetical protein
MTYDFRSFNFLESAVTEDDGLESESLLELLNDGASLVFLDETDGSVQQKQAANDTKVDPIFKTCGENGSSLERIC